MSEGGTLEYYGRSNIEMKEEKGKERWKGTVERRSTLPAMVTMVAGCGGLDCYHGQGGLDSL